MSIVQDAENGGDDPRWITLRVSRINLLINSAGVLFALAMLFLVPLSPRVQIGLAVLFLAAFLWDLRLILLKSRQSVAAFYLFDLDISKETALKSAASAKLGIRVRYALSSGLIGTQHADGVVLSGAFVSPWFTAVRYALPHDPAWRKWWPHIIPVWPDSIDAESFRRVRVALKWK
jgi:hypothetical protein